VGPALTQAHDGAIAEPLGVLHVPLGLLDKVAEHLDGLGIDHFDVVFHHILIHKVLVHELAACPPPIRVLHQKKMVAA
jgi:hypothetical protein